MDRSDAVGSQSLRFNENWECFGMSGIQFLGSSSIAPKAPKKSALPMKTAMRSQTTSPALQTPGQAHDGKPPAQALAGAPSALQRIYFGGLKEAEDIASASIDGAQFKKETETLSWNDYLKRVYDNPRVASNSYQRLYEMIEAGGKNDTGKFDKKHDKVYSYHFFTNPGNGENAIAGMEQPLHHLVKFLKSAAQGGDIRNRFVMFEGPVGTAKSTIMTLLKRGLEDWSKTDKGALYSLVWDNIPEAVAKDKSLQLNSHPKTGRYFYEEPMHDDPLRVIPEASRNRLLGEVNQHFAQLNQGRAPYKVNVEGGLSPASDHIRQKLLEYYTDPQHPDRIKSGETAMSMVLSHVKAKRFVMDETKRTGIATYMPKDPKNQDSTELNGDIDYSKLPMYGDPNHPLVQAYKGEFCVANRGIMEFVEILKLQREFLYDLLTASQERRIKPKNGTLIPTDMVIFGHTNMEELEEKLKDGKMKAFFNRAVEIRVPYLLEPSEEKKIYEKGFVKRCQEMGLKIAPHALDSITNWAVMTRQHPAITKAGGDNVGIGDGKGLYGTSPRFLQSVLSYALVHSKVEETGTVTPITLLRTIKEQLDDGAVKDYENLPHYYQLLNVAKNNLTDTLQKDVYKAFLADEEVLKNYYDKYVEQLRVWENPETRDRADESYLQSVELRMKAPVNEAGRRSFRLNLLACVDALKEHPNQSDDKLLEQDQHLRQALCEVMFDDMKSHLNKVPQDRIIKAMVKKLGYDKESAREAILHLTTPGGILH
jgi:serine protein kinase